MLSQLEGNEKERVTRIMVASVVTGIAVAIAPSLIAWLREAAVPESFICFKNW